MGDKATSVVSSDTPGPQLTPPKKASRAKKARAKATHPPTAEMVNSAIAVLKERGGSSLQAIKKYIAATYKVDPEKHAPFVKKYLKAAVLTGNLVQTKGKGASGSFKLPLKSAESKKPTAKKMTLKKTAIVEKSKVAKKSTAPKTRATKSRSVAVTAKKPQPKKRTAVTKVKKPVPKKVTATKKK